MSVIVDFETIEFHSGCVSCVLYIGKPHFLMVSSSNDGRVCFGDSRSLEFISYNMHTNMVNQLIRWSENYILCLTSHSIRLLRLVPEHPRYFVKKTYSSKDFSSDGESSSGLRKMLKISSSELIVARISPPEILIISITEETGEATIKNILANIITGGIHFYSFLRLSKTFPNSFYFDVMNEHHSVFLIDYSQRTEEKKKFMGKVIREYTHSTYINYIHTYLNHEKEEMLVAGGDDKLVFIYNTNRKGKESLVVKKYLTNSVIYSLNSVVSNNYEYVIVGDGVGQILILDIMMENYDSATEKKSPKVVVRKTIHDGRIYSTSIIKTDSNKIEFFTGSEDCTVRKVRVLGLPFDRNEDEIGGVDERERMEYLKNYNDSIFEGTKRKVFVIQMINETLEIPITRFLYFL